MFQLQIAIILICQLINSSVCQLNCDYYEFMKVGLNYTLSSPGFDQNQGAPMNTNCLWAMESPPGYKIELDCDVVFLMPLLGCNNKLLISKTGRMDMEDADTYCGFGEILTHSLSTRMRVEFRSSVLPMGSCFHCTARVVINDCICGIHNDGKIVNGNATKINEYPYVAGLTDGNQGIICGATIISTKHAITAAHCFNGREFDNMTLLVGEHDITMLNETLLTKAYKIVNVVKHEDFNDQTNANDIAIVITLYTMIYDAGTSNVCLPIKYIGQSMIGKTVQGVGWGSIEFGGPRSEQLRKVNLNIVQSASCTVNQLCSYAVNRDTCTYDSGGPLLLKDNHIYAIGIISYGIACATDVPSVNTNVITYLDWIMSNTKSVVYCVK